MKRTEQILLGLIIVGIFPLLLGLTSIVIWFFADKNENRPLIYLITGLLLGFLIDLIYAKSWIKHRYDMPIVFSILIYLTYNILVYGFFMGFPVFNALMGILAGYYYGNRLCFKKHTTEDQKTLAKKASVFSGLVMGVFCLASGFLALTNSGANGMVKEVLHLNFEVTNTMVVGIVLIGGTILVLTSIFFTRISIKNTIKHFDCNYLSNQPFTNTL